MQLSLVESLTTHGAALARLGNYGGALTAFRRAIDLSQEIGSINRAEQAALKAFQEMGEHLAARREKPRYLLPRITLHAGNKTQRPITSEDSSAEAFTETVTMRDLWFGHRLD